MKRVIIVGLLCLMMSAQGCSANRRMVTRKRSVVMQPNCPHQNLQVLKPDVESEQIKIRRLEAMTAAVLVAGRVTCEVLRVLR